MRRLAGWLVLLAALLINPSLRNFSGMVLHDLLCHREPWTYSLCHEQPSVLAFWDGWRGFRSESPSAFMQWVRQTEAGRSPLNAIKV